MKIGVVSDTHSLKIPPIVLKTFKTVDLIIHAGDFCSTADLEIFSRINKVQAVYGNMDDATLRKILPERQILNLEGCAIGLFHGEGSAQRILETVKTKFKGEKVTAVIFGHSHQALNEYHDGVLYFNPGSPNDMVRAPYRSFGIIEINKGKIISEIVKIKV